MAETAVNERTELLAPAGDWASLEAALEAGADAVYFGLTILNARRGATNFRPDELASATQRVHDRGARAYLTLNIDLSQRELGQAARALELARQARVDAVLVRDPALLALRSCYPELEFHFSTQTCMSSSADVAAAGELGAARVVLAREMSLREIAAASGVAGVRTEVFVQGALCFCVSGRCLLSSWAGGRSGNRGVCTSPCRVPWSVDQEPMGTPLSMRDLAAVHRLADLRRAGVAALKIEGRLKSSAWVRHAVGLYRRALAGEDGAELLIEASHLGAYTGRMLTADYLDGRRDQLTGVAKGREAGAAGANREPEARSAPPMTESGFDLDVTITERGVVCRCASGGRSVEWVVPRTVVRRAHKAVPVAGFLEQLRGQEIHGWRLNSATTNDPAFLLVPRAVSGLFDRVAGAVRQLRKHEEEEPIRIELPAEVRAAIERVGRHAGNDLALGQAPDRARLHASAAAGFLKRLRAGGSVEAMPDGIILEGSSAEALEKLLPACGEMPVVVALPSVLFEEDLRPMEQLLAACAGAGVGVEVNSWGGWRLARQAGVAMEGGPGLAVLNALAARVLGERGMRSVTASVEADRKQLEDLTGQCPVPCSVVVFGRPALMVTRVQLDRQRMLGRVFEDRRGVKMMPRAERGLIVFRPVEAFDLRQTRNDRIRAHHLVVDLVASPDPAGEWLRRGPAGGKPFRFNYDRTLV